MSDKAETGATVHEKPKEKPFDIDALSSETFSYCGDKRGGCQCGMIWSELGSSTHVATVTIGKWGDQYPAIRVDQNDKMKAEAYMEHHYYGEISERRGKAVTARLVACWNALRGIADPEKFVSEAKNKAKRCKKGNR